ncbi:MAG: hypothetical protein FJX21_13950, partial [Alphaproteobacteria bacterium]|nr:hypothetical protein [Alphaproteobacteria bacterium]
MTTSSSCIPAASRRSSPGTSSGRMAAAPQPEPLEPFLVPLPTSDLTPKEPLMHRRSALALLSGAAAVQLLGWRNAVAQAAPGKTLTYGQSTRVTALDPAQGAFSTYPGGYEVGYCMFDRLVDFDENLKIVPSLATSWELAPDVKSVRFKLRQGVKFHDGTPLDAAAVKFTVERLVDRERTPTNRPLWDVVAGVDIVDAETVVVRTKSAFSQILNSFAHGSGSIVSPAAVAKHG